MLYRRDDCPLLGAHGIARVGTSAEYIAAVDDKRRSYIAPLDALIRKHAPKLEPVIMGGILGYGPFHYRSASGREGDACKLLGCQNRPPDGVPVNVRVALGRQLTHLSSEWVDAASIHPPRTRPAASA